MKTLRKLSARKLTELEERVKLKKLRAFIHLKPAEHSRLRKLERRVLGERIRRAGL